jgi:hypothetical protein
MTNDGLIRNSRKQLWPNQGMVPAFVWEKEENHEHRSLDVQCSGQALNHSVSQIHAESDACQVKNDQIVCTETMCTEHFLPGKKSLL